MLLICSKRLRHINSLSPQDNLWRGSVITSLHRWGDWSWGRESGLLLKAPAWMGQSPDSKLDGWGSRSCPCHAWSHILGGFTVKVNNWLGSNTHEILTDSSWEVNCALIYVLNRFIIVTTCGQFNRFHRHGYLSLFPNESILQNINIRPT